MRMRLIAKYANTQENCLVEASRTQEKKQQHINTSRQITCRCIYTIEKILNVQNVYVQK